MASVSFSPLANVSSNTHILTSSEFQCRKKLKLQVGFHRKLELKLGFQNFHSLNTQQNKIPEPNKKIQLIWHSLGTKHTIYSFSQQPNIQLENNILTVGIHKDSVFACRKKMENAENKQEIIIPWKEESLSVLEAMSLAATLPQLPLPTTVTLVFWGGSAGPVV